MFKMTYFHHIFRTIDGVLTVKKKQIGGKGLKKRSVEEEVWSVVCFNVLQQNMRVVICLKLRRGEEELWSEVYF